MAYSIRKNWIESFNLMIKRPIVILPFLIIAFLEGVALELIYFSSRKPLSALANPIVRKFSREVFVHYPGNMIILPKIFYVVQSFIYVSIGVFLVAMSVNVIKNIRLELSLKRSALIKNNLKRYLSFFTFGVLTVALMYLLNKSTMFIFIKMVALVDKYLPQALLEAAPFVMTFFAFLANVILHTFLILVVPIIVLNKKSVFKALWRSIVLVFRNFFTLFPLIFLPFLVYLPITLLKTNALKLVEITFPEINLYLTTGGIILTAFLECFIIICAVGFLMDKQAEAIKE